VRSHPDSVNVTVSVFEPVYSPCAEPELQTILALPTVSSVSAPRLPVNFLPAPGPGRKFVAAFAVGETHAARARSIRRFFFGGGL